MSIFLALVLFPATIAIRSTGLLIYLRYWFPLGSLLSAHSLLFDSLFFQEWNGLFKHFWWPKFSHGLVSIIFVELGFIIWVCQKCFCIIKFHGKIEVRRFSHNIPLSSTAFLLHPCLDTHETSFSAPFSLLGTRVDE